MWTIVGLPFWEVIQHEILHCLYSLLFLLVIYFASQGICWLVGWDYIRIISTNGFLLWGFLVCSVLVSHYFADEIIIIIPPWA
ncbi:hypothetical protein LCGC14_0340930 [marine sediment metagenome]|uniref:Uncharacterized protein n=1 Tax=marine sediment metagenome TaxID=412755 RepID=A0A0F9W0Y1_9ZZZZ